MKTLVVAADGEIGKLMEGAARSRGHEVEVFTSAQSAWEAFSRQIPGLVLVEGELADGSGLELCHQIRTVSDSSRTGILVVTDRQRRGAADQALDSGADDCLLAPLSADELDVRLAIAERRLEDLRRRYEAKEKLIYEALHDPLTELVKPAILVDRLDRAARGASRRTGRLFAVLYLSLDDYEQVNESLGAERNPRLLVEVSRRLEECLRAIDTVSRWAEHEFVILLDDLRDVSDPTRVASRIHEALARPIRIQGRGAIVGASIGIALSATGFREASELLRHAQEAMDQVREEGGGRYHLYDPVLNARVAARVQLETRLRRAVERHQLEVRYQPIVRLKERRIVGFEALMQWQDGEHIVPPSTFIPVAEETRLIHPLGWWIFSEACRQLGDWRAQFSSKLPLAMSINVSGMQFSEPDVLFQVEEAISSAGLSGGSGVNIEITESTLMENVESTQDILRQLKGRDLRLHVDNFGTGYSSLSYLCRFPIDALKIDRSFIEQMTVSPENLEIVRTIVQLSENLGMTAVAEGVETEEQLEKLLELGCVAGQGHLFAPALAASEATELLVEQES